MPVPGTIGSTHYFFNPFITVASILWAKRKVYFITQTWPLLNSLSMANMGTITEKSEDGQPIQKQRLLTVIAS